MTYRWFRPALVVLMLAAVWSLPVEAAKARGKAKPDDAKPAAAAPVAARIGETSITFDELDVRARSANLQAFQQLYDARRAVLDELVAQTLFDIEAKARGITRDELVDQEITQKITAPDDAAIEKFFNENKGRIGQATLEQVAPQIRGFLEAESSSKVRLIFIDQLRAKTPVQIHLELPRAIVEVAANDPAKGPADAPLQIILFSEFQ